MKFLYIIFLLIPLGINSQSTITVVNEFTYDYELTHVTTESDACITILPEGSGNYDFTWYDVNDSIIGYGQSITSLSQGIYKLITVDSVPVSPTTGYSYYLYTSYTYFWIGKYGETTTLSFQPDSTYGIDAYIINHTHPVYNGENTNYGKSTSIFSDAGTNSGYPNYARFLIKFQYNGLKDATIDSVSLDLFAYQYRNQPQNTSTWDNELFLKRVDDGELWDEHTVTWNSNIFAVTTDQVMIDKIGGSYDFHTNLQYMRSADITTLAELQINDTNENNGFLVQLADEYRYRFQYFYSSDYTDSSKRPKITIKFSLPSDAERVSCVTDTVLPCETCIGSFAPIPSGKYLISAWTKEDGASPNKLSYDNPQLSIVCQTSGGPVTLGPFSPSGAIIDQWQRIEEEFTIPSSTTSIQLVLSSVSGDVYFDDIRMFPFDASMKTYVYDPINMRLSAELDERHFATYYEYDEEGKLIRIKKETEKGVMTIQETKSNSSK